MFLLLIAGALFRISILLIKDFGGKTNVFDVDCRGISKNFHFYDKDFEGSTNIFAVDCRGICQKLHFYDKRLWREEK
jgi:hypothetical protein